MSLCTWAAPRAASSADGVSRPASIDSVPITWASWSCTVQPGQSVALAQSGSSSDEHNSSRRRHSSSNSSMTGSSTPSLPCWSAGRYRRCRPRGRYSSGAIVTPSLGAATGSWEDQGKLIQRSVRFQTYSHLMTERGFS